MYFIIPCKLIEYSTVSHLCLLPLFFLALLLLQQLQTEIGSSYFTAISIWPYGVAHLFPLNLPPLTTLLSFNSAFSPLQLRCALIVFAFACLPACGT